MGDCILPGPNRRQLLDLDGRLRSDKCPKKQANRLSSTDDAAASVRSSQEDSFMSQQPNDETRNQTTSATPGQSETISKSEKVNNDLLEDELSQISGGITKHPDQY